MSNSQITETISATPGVALVERVMTVFDNETERLVTEYPLHSFDLKDFKHQFAVTDDDDPLMYNVYPVAPKDGGFVSKYLNGEVVFDFDKNAYFIECYDAG